MFTEFNLNEIKAFFFHYSHLRKAFESVKAN